MAARPSPHAYSCKKCIQYITDWHDQELCGSFDKWTGAHLSRVYLPKATAEIIRLLMKYLEEYEHYTKIQGALKTHVELGGVHYAINLFTTTIPIVAETVEHLEHLMAESSAKDYDAKQEWIRQTMFTIFMDLIDIHGVHLGKAPFTDVWYQRYKKRIEEMQRTIRNDNQELDMYDELIVSSEVE